jgi:hypothetical protein
VQWSWSLHTLNGQAVRWAKAKRGDEASLPPWADAS